MSDLSKFEARHEPKHEPKIVHHAAECSADCQDRMCPYPHLETWEVSGAHYRSQEDARAAIAKAEA